ncbi:hypothetical protein KUTeg_022787 [Tegillarca granosa]|uniref:Uncharacterized protein n=1 Tax=Tegillarca granosa TaxID=220873 RepID=A0ABQ9E4D1_TEGGR|nr:hypothetical protein KUTeg_022787 [Tegillarca granosa]
MNRTMPSSYSFDYEPKPDYDFDTPSSSPTRDILRSHSSISSIERRVTAPPAPPPPPVVDPKDNKLSEQGANSSQKSTVQRQHSLNDFSAKPSVLRHHSMNVPSSPTKSPQNETVPWLVQLKKATEERSSRRQLSENVDTPKPPEDKSVNNVEQPKLVFSSSDNNIQTSVPKSENEVKNNSEKTPPPVMEKKTSATSLERKNSTTSSSSATSSLPSTQNGDPTLRRLSSLLQHDIKLAAQAKATKIVKHTTPVKEKPKDPAEVFREQLAKAASEREDRMKNTKSIDDQLGVGRQFSDYKVKDVEKSNEEVFKTDKVTVKKAQSFKKEESPSQKEVITIDKEEFPKQKFVKKSQKEVSDSSSPIKHSRQRLPEVESGNIKANKSFEKEWTPEDDLESDDDISDRETVTLRKAHSEGFKSTIVPSKVDDLKKGKSKSKKYTKKNNADIDEKRKYDSIKRFKKSVHKSVKNAFGSISKASGKILKQRKSDDFEQVDEIDRNPNWQFSSTMTEPSLIAEQSRTARAYKYMVPNAYQDHESEDTSEDEQNISQRSKVAFENGDVHDEEVEHSDDSESENEAEGENYRLMKRAGVAYVSKKGQIVVLP